MNYNYNAIKLCLRHDITITIAEVSYMTQTYI